VDFMLNAQASVEVDHWQMLLPLNGAAKIVPDPTPGNAVWMTETTL
jgi:hypothetical protein